MNESEFKKLTGRDPVDDDLDRANCHEAGTLGHAYCGLCDSCGYPKFECYCGKQHATFESN